MVCGSLGFRVWGLGFAVLWGLGLGLLKVRFRVLGV